MRYQRYLQNFEGISDSFFVAWSHYVPRINEFVNSGTFNRSMSFSMQITEDLNKDYLW